MMTPGHSLGRKDDDIGKTYVEQHEDTILLPVDGHDVWIGRPRQPLVMHRHCVMAG